MHSVESVRYLLYDCGALDVMRLGKGESRNATVD